jgi:hypothetical protein
LLLIFAVSVTVSGDVAAVAAVAAVDAVDAVAAVAAVALAIIAGLNNLSFQSYCLSGPHPWYYSSLTSLWLVSKRTKRSE